MRCVYSETARDSLGNVVGGATVRVYLAGTTTSATFYQYESDTSATTGVSTGSDGVFTLYVDRFDYDSDQKFKIIISRGTTSITYDNVSMDRVVTGTYTISADKTVSTHINVPKGVVYSVASGKTLTISGELSAGLYQIFSGSGTVTGLKESYPEWFGGGPSVTDNQAALDAAMTSLASGGTLILTQQYPVTTEWVINTLTRFNIDFRGGYISATDCNAMKIYKSTLGTISNVDIVYTGTDGVGWTANASGLTLDGASHTTISIKRIQGFLNGLNLTTSGAWGNTYLPNITMGKMYNNKFDIWIDNHASGWATDIGFHGGFYGLESSYYATVTGDYAVYMDTVGAGINNIRMYNPCFEYHHNGIYGYVAEFSLIHPRFENVAANWLQYIFVRSTFIGGYGNWNPTYINLNSNSIQNTFIGKWVDGSSEPPVVSAYGDGQLAVLDRYGAKLLKTSPSWTSANLGTSLKDPLGTRWWPIKVSNGQPSTGSYGLTAIVFNSNTAGGQAMGWICTAAGTAGTLNSGATTATGTSGTATVTVNDVTGLYPFAVVDIVGTTGEYIVYTIDTVNKVVTFTTNINASVTDAAMSFHAPTWTALPATY